MADTELNISPDEKVAGVPLARLLRNLDETSYNEGSVDLACRLTDCKAVIEELLQQRAPASRPAEVDDKHQQDLRDVFDLAWNQALADAAFYISGHCPDGDFYIDTIVELVPPKLRVRGVEIARRAAPSRTTKKDGA